MIYFLFLFSLYNIIITIIYFLFFKSEQFKIIFFKIPLLKL